MKLLLDTPIWLWALFEPERLSPAVRVALASGEHELWHSPISVRQALLLVERGRVRVDTMPTEFVERMMRMLPRREAALTHDSAIASRQLALT